MSALAGQLQPSIVVPGVPPSSQDEQRLKLLCPECRTELSALPWASLSSHGQPLECHVCSFVLRQERCIWNALPFCRQKYYERFMREYEAVRASEGRGSTEPAYYLALPHKDLTHRHRWQWKIRSRSYRYIERRILPQLERKRTRPLDALDLGAGNGWLSYRLALRGHSAVAVDLLTNTFDGLGAASHYLAVLPSLFPRFQGELDRLPFADSQFDLVVFNASFHYSENYARTLCEAIRCLRPDGSLMIVDSPWYSNDEFGQSMVRERRQNFQERFSFPSDALASCEYLTDERLALLESNFELKWTIHQPWYGLRWAARPWLAKWKRRREPAQFRIYTAEVKPQ
jgi:SAM-dependent methyltransferase